MTKITIDRTDHWLYSFYTDERDNEVWHDAIIEHCCYCGMDLSRAYSFIINSLKEAKLLPEDYELICCYCDILKELGLIDLCNALNGVYYDSDKDIINLCFAVKLEGNLPDEEIEFYIHDFSKTRGKKYESNRAEKTSH